MIRQEDIIKQSGIIKYLEERLNYWNKELKEADDTSKLFTGYDMVECIVDELETNLEHFKEMAKDE